MIVELFGTYDLNRKIDESEIELGTDTSRERMMVSGLVLFIYLVITAYVAIRYPVANNLLISMILALFFTPLFWILKVIEFATLSLNKK